MRSAGKQHHALEVADWSASLAPRVPVTRDLSESEKLLSSSKEAVIWNQDGRGFDVELWGFESAH